MDKNYEMINEILEEIFYELDGIASAEWWVPSEEAVMDWRDRLNNLGFNVQIGCTNERS